MICRTFSILSGLHSRQSAWAATNAKNCSYMGSFSGFPPIPGYLVADGLQTQILDPFLRSSTAIESFFMMGSSTFARRMWAAWILIVFGASTIAGGQQTSGGLDVVQVRPNFYMIAGAGGNIGVQIGVDGVVLVDAGTEGASDRVLAAIRKLTELPTRYIINTGAEPDHA